MKNLILPFLCLLLLFQSCQKEDFDNNLLQNNQSKIEKVSLEKLLENNTFKSVFQKTFRLSKSVTNSNTARESTENKFNFTFNDQDAFVINTDSVISYTFAVTVKNKKTSKDLTNLVIENNIKSNQIKATLLTYKNKKGIDEIEDIGKNETELDFQSINYIYKNPNSSNVKLREHVCIEITYYECTNPKATHEPGGIGCEAKPQTKIWCSWVETDPFNTGGTSGSSTTPGTGTGGGTVISSGILTVPVISEYHYTPNKNNGGNYLNFTTTDITFFNSTNLNRKLRQFILTNYNPEDNPDVTAKQVLVFLQKNQQALTDINSYLLNNNTSSSENLIYQILNYSIKNPDLKLNFIQSLKSPVNVDSSAIDLNTIEGQRFNEVYEKLTQSPEFKKLFLDVFQNGDRFNVKFQIAPITSGANGDTRTNLVNPTLNTITISPNFLRNNNKLIIAKTILHECIHAYLNVKLCDPSIGMSISNINNMDFIQTINSLYNGFNGNQGQHNFIYNYMLPTMVQVLSEIKNLVIHPQDIQTLEGLSYYPPPNQTSTPFNWNTFLHNVSLGGLQSCPFFQNEIGTFYSNGTFTEVNPILMHYYNTSQSYAQTHIRP